MRPILRVNLISSKWRRDNAYRALFARVIFSRPILHLDLLGHSNTEHYSFLRWKINPICAIILFVEIK